MAFTISNTIPASILLTGAPIAAPVNYPTSVDSGAPVGNVEYIISVGELPLGLTINEFDGTISGNPRQVQAYSFTISGRDSGGFIATAAYAGVTEPDPSAPPTWGPPAANPVQAYETFPYSFVYYIYTWNFDPLNILQTAGLPTADTYSDDGFGTVTITAKNGAGFYTGITTNCYEYTDTFGNVGFICFDIEGLAGEQSSGKIVQSRLVDPVSGGPSFDIEVFSSALYSGNPGGLQVVGSWINLEQ